MSALVTTMLAAAMVAMPAVQANSPNVTVSKTFGTTNHAAMTYDTQGVPKGSRAVVTEKAHGAHGTKISLEVKGLKAGHHYGAHVHTKPCGAKPADAGPHYQNVKDPVSPSVNPKYANSRNEVWLDFHADGKGTGHAQRTVDWRFRKGEARSVIIHDHGTSTKPGTAGTAGDRLACVTVPFD